MPSDPAVEAGIERVLEAERAAREAVARCEQDAAVLVERARARARHIAQRADTRISALRIQYRNEIAHHLSALRSAEERHAGTLGPGPEQQARLERAVAVLAAQLTGGN
jgi:vacuolar-type H+-ATPase subunit H